jgi:hypothetical protein
MTALPASFKSFDTRPLGRVFWKEYRAQRGLWLAVLFLGMVLQLVMRMTVEIDVQLVVMLWLVPLYMPAFFLIGSSAMLFALEREERTSDWLLNLSAPPMPILVAKITFAIVSSLCLFVALCLSAIVFSFGSGVQLNWVFRERMEVRDLFLCLATFVLIGSGILIWSTLGSLTSRRVVMAVPAGLAWWLAIVVAPLAFVHHVGWFLYGQESLGPGRVWVDGCVMFLGYVVTVTMNISLGLRWSRGEYFDATWWSALHDRLLAKLNWHRVQTTRVPSTIENEHSGWRTWQRLVWQERHRESLHTLLLVIVSAMGVLLALYSRGTQDSLTFVVIPFLIAMPFAMGVIGFRFDSAGQQLRFLANRGTSAAMIWSAKHAVWLPRAFWISIVCWVVACMAESVIIPWGGGLWVPSNSEFDRVRHPLVVGSYHVLFGSDREPSHIADILWFTVASYAAGQIAALLLRRMVLAVGVGLFLGIALAYWQSLTIVLSLPRWWSIGGVVLWFVGLAWWYSGHWLIERRNWSVVQRLVAGLTLPPLALMVGVAVYRWLEIPGFGPSSPTVMALMYPREAKRREHVGDFGIREIAEIRAAIEMVSSPVLSEDLEKQKRLTDACKKCMPMVSIRTRLDASLDASAGQFPVPVGGGNETKNPPAVVSLEERQRIAEERFWSQNKEPLETILILVKDDFSESYRIGQKFAADHDIIIPPPELFTVAGRLSLKRGDPKKAMAYYLAGLRFARHLFRSTFWDKVFENRHPAAPLFQSIVDWANEDSVSREQLLAAIRDIKRELSRFPSLREMSVNSFVWAERDLQFQVKSQLSPAARCAVVVLLSQEIARRRRIGEQALFWEWNRFRYLESLVEYSPFNPFQQISEWEQQVFGAGTLKDDDPTLQVALNSFGDPDKNHVTMFLDREAVDRQTLLALTLALWKKDHDGELPGSLDDLARYCENDTSSPERVLPVLALNDPWCGGMFDYSAQGTEISWANIAKSNGDAESNGMLLIPASRIPPSRMAAESIQPNGKIKHRHVGNLHGPFPTSSVAICLQNGRLQLAIFPRTKR